MNHKHYIQRALQLAKNGIGTTRPNPSVGAVIVLNDRIIGEGFTSPYGGNHAEVNAINSVLDKTFLKQATIYVTLEPCSHFGKTPPCADLIIKHHFKQVVIGCVDTNSLVAGKGIERLKNAGINVITNVLEQECLQHHKRFFTVQNKKRPFIILKWAQSQDGFIAPISKNEQKPVWISNKNSQQLVHKWRNEEHAILVGTNTVIADNPKLNVRSWSGNNPVRIVLDATLRLSDEIHVFDGSVKTIVFIEKRENRNEKTDEHVLKMSYRAQSRGNRELIFESIDFSSRVAEQICEVLQKHQIQSVIIEGGKQTLQTFIDAELWDEARIFTGDLMLDNGVEAPIFKSAISSEEKINNDILRTYIND